MKIALTGSTGFIGKNLKNFFERKNFNVITLGRHKSSDIKFDLLKNKNLKYKISCDILIHAASISVNEIYRKKKINANNITKIISSELNSLKVLINFCKTNKVKKIIFISSASVYGKNLKNKSFKTTQVASPSDIYGALKLSMEILGSKLFKNFISLRLFQVYGPNDLSFRLVPTAIDKKNIKLKNPYNVTDMIYYKDLNNLIYKLIKSKKINKGKFNAGCGKPINLLNLVKKIIRLKNNNSSLNFSKNVLKEKTFSFADINDLKKKLSWKPDYDINSGLKELINERKV